MPARQHGRALLGHRPEPTWQWGKAWPPAAQGPPRRERNQQRGLTRGERRAAAATRRKLPGVLTASSTPLLPRQRLDTGAEANPQLRPRRRPSTGLAGHTAWTRPAARRLASAAEPAAPGPMRPDQYTKTVTVRTDHTGISPGRHRDSVRPQAGWEAAPNSARSLEVTNGGRGGYSPEPCERLTRWGQTGNAFADPFSWWPSMA